MSETTSVTSERGLAPSPATGQALEQAKAPVGYGKSGVMLANLAELWRFAELVNQSGLAPKGLDTPQKVAVAIQYGAEFGVPPMASIRGVRVINGIPGWMGDMALGIVRASGKMLDYEKSFTGTPGSDDYAAVVTTLRKDAGRPLTTIFGVRDAKLAGLWGKQGPWTQYPDRMLYYRALGFNLRDNFPDVMAGAAIAEEMQDFPINELKHVGPGSTQRNALAAATPTDPLLESIGVKAEPVAVPIGATDAQGAGGQGAPAMTLCLHGAVPDPVPAGKTLVCLDCGEEMKGIAKEDAAPCCGGAHGPGEACGKELRAAVPTRRSSR